MNQSVEQQIDGGSLADANLNSPHAVLQVFVFKGDHYLGMDCFPKQKITIGSSSRADVILDDTSISAIHAIVKIKNHKIYSWSVSSKKSSHGKKQKAALGALDVLEVGPYSIKIKQKSASSGEGGPSESGPRKKTRSVKPPAPEPLTEKEGEAPSTVRRIKSRAAVVRTELPVTKKRTQGNRKNDTLVKVRETDTTSQNETDNITSRNSDVLPETEKPTPRSVPSKLPENVTDEDTSKDDTPSDRHLFSPNTTAPDSHRENLIMWPGTVCEDDDDEDDEPDLAASFSLQEKLSQQMDLRSTVDQAAPYILEIIKFRKGQVQDIQYLDVKQKYTVYDASSRPLRRFCLAASKSESNHVLYFRPDFDLTVTTADGNVLDMAALRGLSTLYRRRREIYRLAITPDTRICFSDGFFTYHIWKKRPSMQPIVKVAQEKDNRFWKHLARSGAVHFFLMVFVGFFATITPPDSMVDEGRFVRINRDQLRLLQQKSVVPPPKPSPKPEIAKAPPVVKKAAEKPLPPKSKPKTVKKHIAEKAPAGKKAAAKRVASRHPNAGGGHGKGNVKARNIKQTGILSLLGNSVGIQPESAVAAVTNLDAVQTTSAVNKGYKVGGIVGKVGNGEIRAPATGIVNTRGTTQVLRSAGVGGKGDIAAMERGAVGEGHVMAMVTAKLDRSVSVRGGMRREEVKRVIDQHMSEITNCYETALVVNPSIMGKVVFEWKILLSGKVGEVRILSSTLNSQEIHSCIQAAIRSWRFPAPKGSAVMVSYPFIFDIVGF